MGMEYGDFININTFFLLLFIQYRKIYVFLFKNCKIS